MKIPGENSLKSTFVKTVGGLLPTSKSPDEGLGELFDDVQHQRVYGDGKTFVDLVPRRRMKQIQQEYLLERTDPHFDLREFVAVAPLMVLMLITGLAPNWVLSVINASVTRILGG